ncbi:hypothetical protein B0T20DRAFT_466588 [Sordaria brevicollis]|uniref:Uncharacterized protein n=1 Tax=Sordaria brevicollis TaxID=83679 RepID=A0AAE0PKH7_SORBR|nr:hypothetical protein B0T20DRAFT_466588 [Sordaria brevicollis]
MITGKESLANDGFHEPLQFDWRVTGYFRSSHIGLYNQQIAKGTYKYLRRNNWPPKDLQYELSNVEPLSEYSREQLDQLSLINGPIFCALQVRITLVLQNGGVFVPQNMVDLSESLVNCMFVKKSVRGNFNDSLPIDGEYAVTHCFSEVYAHVTDALGKAMPKELLHGAGRTHTRCSHLYPAFAILNHLSKLAEFKRSTQAHPLAVKQADKSTDPEDVRSSMAQLREDYVKYYEDSQQTIAVACNEDIECTPKAIRNAVTNIGLMEGSLRGLISVIESHLGKSAPRSRSRFFVKRWIMDKLSATDPPTICLDTSDFDVVQCKRKLRNSLTRYQRAMRALVTSIRLLDPAAGAAFNKVVDSTANTPDKAEYLQLYGFDGTREQAQRSIQVHLKTTGILHGMILEQLDLLNDEIARATTSVECCWWDSEHPDEKQSCSYLEQDDEDAYSKAHLIAASRP